MKDSSRITSRTALGRGDGHGIAAEGVEVADVLPELLEKFGLECGCRDRDAVAHGDDVRDGAVALEAPPLLSRAAEARLDYGSLIRTG